MQDEQIKLQDAFNKGFIPADLKKAMEKRGHVGQVWVTDTQTYERSVKTGENDQGLETWENEPAIRLGVGYSLIDDEGQKSNHIHWYEQEDVAKLLKEIR